MRPKCSKLFKVGGNSSTSRVAWSEQYHPTDGQGAGRSGRDFGLHRRALRASKRFKDDVKEVREGLESCGIGIENFNDLKAGDRIESFRMEEIKRTLAFRPRAGLRGNGSYW